MELSTTQVHYLSDNGGERIVNFVSWDKYVIDLTTELTLRYASELSPEKISRIVDTTTSLLKEKLKDNEG